MGYIFAFMAILIWSTLEVTGKLIGNDINAYAITVWRFLIGGIVLIPLMIPKLKKDKIKLKFLDILKLTYPGILNVAISMLFLQLAIYYGEASTTAAIISANSIFVAIISFFILKEKISPLRLLGLFLGIIGMIAIMSKDSSQIATAKNNTLGIVFGILAAVTFAFYTVINKKYAKNYGVITSNTVSFIMGAIILAIGSLAFGIDLTFEPSTKNILMVLYQGIIITALAYVIYFEGLKRISTTAGSMFFFLKPVLAAIFAYFALNEVLSTIQIFGIIIIVLGVNIEKIINLFKQTKRT